MPKPSTRQFAVLAALLRPAAAFCLRHGLHIQDLLEVAKQSFLDAAQSDLETKSGKSNISRLSAATGIHRRDVMRIVQRGEGKKEPQGLISRVLGQWQFDKKFLTSSGRPRKLALSEFGELVKIISHDLNPGTLLFELERLGAVERTGETVSLRSRVYVPAGDTDAGYKMLAKDVLSLTRSVEDNLEAADEVPNLHASTEFDNVRLDALPALRRWLLHEGSKFHAKVRARLARYDCDVTRSQSRQPAGGRVVFCSFGLIEETRP